MDEGLDPTSNLQSSLAITLAINTFSVTQSVTSQC